MTEEMRDILDTIKICTIFWFDEAHPGFYDFEDVNEAFKRLRQEFMKSRLLVDLFRCPFVAVCNTRFELRFIYGSDNAKTLWRAAQDDHKVCKDDPSDSDTDPLFDLSSNQSEGENVRLSPMRYGDNASESGTDPLSDLSS